jgi:exopolysaccharide biosynthesis polyprenyl glycosylphosphotransferase
MTTIDNDELPRPNNSTGPLTAIVAQLPAQSPPLRPIRPVGTAWRRTPVAVAPAVLAGVDALALLLALAAVGPGDLGGTLRAAAAVVPVLALLNSSGGLYRLRLAPSVLDELPALAGRAAVALALALGVDRCAHRLTAFPTDVRLLSALLLCQLVLDGLGRTTVHTFVRRARRRCPRPTLVAGAGHIGQRVTAALLEHPEYGLRPVGYVDRDPIFLAADSPVPVLGGHSVLDLEIPAQGIRDIILTSCGSDDAEVAQTLRTSARHGCDVWFVPGFPEFGAFEYGNRRTAMGDHLWGFPCLRLGRGPMQRPSWAVKRATDATLAGFALLLAAPVLVLCALAVRIDGGPGVIFRQERVGLDGRPFTVFKFRTLRPADEQESATRWNISQDHRMSAIGRFLRRSSLDELPQLWNVLRGEMSLVGPRPERPYFVTRFAQAYPRYRDRHRVPVGITGFAQVNGLRGDTSIEDRARFDNYYIESWSLWQDVKILLRTVASVIHSDGS